MKRPAKLGIGLGAVAVVLAVVWVFFLPRIVEHELRAVTGFDFRVAVLTANPFTGRVVVRGLTADNPKGYPTKEFVDVRAVLADVELFSCFSGRIVVDDLDLDISKVELVREHDGTTNAGALMAAFGSKGPAGAAPAKPIRYLVKKLHVSFDTLVVADYSGSKLDEKSYNLHLDQTFLNVDSPTQLFVPNVLKTLHDFGLQHDIARLLPGDFGQALSMAVGSATNIGQKLKGATEQTGSYLRGLFDKLDQKGNP